MQDLSSHGNLWLKVKQGSIILESNFRIYFISQKGESDDCCKVQFSEVVGNSFEILKFTPVEDLRKSWRNFMGGGIDFQIVYNINILMD